jgi:hypothetical protein
MKFGLFPVFLFAGIFQTHTSYAQTRQEDSIFYQSALAHTVSFYYNQLGDQSQIFNGSVYSAYGFTFREGSPYFLSDKFGNGSVIYDGILFDSLSLIYEDLRELVITKDQGLLLQLISERISGFTVSGHHFIRLMADSLNRGITRTGFYEILYPGTSRVLKKTFKNMREVASVYEGLIRYVDESNDYYIKTGNIYKRVKSKTDFIESFPDHQKDIQHFIKKNKLNFHRDKENTLVKTAEYYDQITK